MIQRLLPVLLLLAACSSEPGTTPDSGVDLRVDLQPVPDNAMPDAPVADSAAADLASTDLGTDAGVGGEVLVLTYNVAGLPFGLSKSDPDKNTPLISPLLNPFDLVLMQEDFSYTAQLSSQATHPYKSTPGQPQGTVLNDGLTLFSRLPFSGLTRHKWVQCFGFLDHGSDCLAAKGFSVATLELAAGVTLHVYNLHMDAGQDTGDYNARAAEVDQLLKSLSGYSSGEAVIVAGDTNLKVPASVDNQGLLNKLLGQGALTDACDALSCGDQRIDRVMYRSSAALTLQALSWQVDPSFVDAAGQDLSDHKAVAVRLRWTAAAAPVDAGAPPDLTAE